MARAARNSAAAGDYKWVNLKMGAEMRAFGVILTLLGVSIAAFGFYMTGAAPGERVLNIGLLNEKALLVTIGGALLICGAALLGAAGIAAAVNEHKNAVLAEMRGEREDLRIGFKSLWEELDRVRANTEPGAHKCKLSGEMQPVPEPAVERPGLASRVGSMGYCPNCRKLRHSSVAKCVYCSSTNPVSVS